jgi:hypothetical protein
MTFDEWWATTYGTQPNYADNPVVREPARAAWEAATGRAATVAERCAERNRSCPKGCMCGDGWHIAMAIRGGK